MNILVIIGHPFAGSLNHALAHEYAESARNAGAHVDVIDLAEDASPDHPRTLSDVRRARAGSPETIDAHVEDYLARVRAADHLALFYPMWWGTYPAVLKQFFDRVLLSGDAYASRAKASDWVRGLKGRTARITHTSDSPRLFAKIAYHDASIASVKTATLWYTGIKTIGVRHFANVRGSSLATRQKWIARIGRDGASDAKRTPNPAKNMLQARALVDA